MFLQRHHCQMRKQLVDSSNVAHLQVLLPSRKKMASENQPNLDVIKQEEAYLRKVHPTPEDVPGCMKLFDDFLLCNGRCSSLHTSRNKSNNDSPSYHSDGLTDALVVSLWRDGHMLA